MPIDKATALAQIDDVLKRCASIPMDTVEGPQEIMTLLCATIQRLAPPRSAYLDQMTDAPKGAGRYGGSIEFLIAKRLEGILKALRADYDAGRLQSFTELVHADLFSDFLEMAEYFLGERFKDPAAVIAGGVLEQHLRKLCAKHGVALPAMPKLDTMNADLAKAGAYGKNDQKQVTAWADLRNDAAHGTYSKYTPEQVKLMVAGIRDFISRNPA